MARIENHKYSIEDGFRECFYLIPDYQREYVWTSKEVRQLLDDIDEQISAETVREYFIGMVLVSPTADKNHYEVIDGQQRLTTLFLILCALKQRFGSEPQSRRIGELISTGHTDTNGEVLDSLKLEPRYENASEVMRKLVEVNGTPDELRSAMQRGRIATFGSLENLLNAYDVVYQFIVDNYKDSTQLKKYWGYLSNNVVFIQISADVSSALKIFETINERGVGLNPMDLLKNLLFTHVQQEQFTRLKDEWKAITKPLEKEKEKPLRFLRYFLMANYRITNERSDAVVREDEIYDWFMNDSNAAMCNFASQPFEFVKKIARDVELYLTFLNARGNDGNANTAMESLQSLCGGAFSLHYILLLASSNLQKEHFDHFVGQLESFLFYYIFTKTPSKYLERNFSLWADELRAIGEQGDPQQQREALNEFIAKRFQSSIENKQQELVDALRRYSLNSMQIYRTRYFLSRLTQYVDMAYKGMVRRGSLNAYDGLQIEHILPNNPKDALRREFDTSSAGASYDDYKNRLGNLTLLEKPINIVAGNDFYTNKKSEYKKCKHYLTSSLAGLAAVGKDSSVTRINAKLAEFDVWSAATIEARQEILIRLAREVWTAVPLN